MAIYQRGTEGRLNDILTVLGTTKASLWPFWEATGTLVTCIGPGDLTPAETGGAAEALEDDFAPVALPCKLHSYHLHPTGDHHLAGSDNASYSFTGDAPFSAGAWIRPTTVVSNTVIAKYDAAGTAREWRLWIGPAGLLTFELYDESADATEIGASTAALTAGQWQHVTVTYDGTAATPEVWLYVDAAVVSDGTTTETGAYVGLEDTATPLTIGCSGTTAAPAGEFHGRIALPYLCGAELTAGQVRTLHAYTAPMVGIC